MLHNNLDQVQPGYVHWCLKFLIAKARQGTMVTRVFYYNKPISFIQLFFSLVGGERGKVMPPKKMDLMVKMVKMKLMKRNTKSFSN